MERDWRRRVGRGSEERECGVRLGKREIGK